MKEKIIKFVITIVLCIGFIVSSVLYFTLGITWYATMLFIIFDIVDLVSFLFLFKNSKKFVNVCKEYKKDDKVIKINKNDRSFKILRVILISIVVIALILCIFIVFGIISYVKTNDGNLMFGALALLMLAVYIDFYCVDLFYGRIVEYKLYTITDKKMEK